MIQISELTANKNPGATAIATGANDLEKADGLPLTYRPKPRSLATYFWDRASNSVQPLAALGSA